MVPGSQCRLGDESVRVCCCALSYHCRPTQLRVSVVATDLREGREPMMRATLPHPMVLAPSLGYREQYLRLFHVVTCAAPPTRLHVTKWTIGEVAIRLLAIVAMSIGIDSGSPSPKDFSSACHAFAPGTWESFIRPPPPNGAYNEQYERQIGSLCVFVHPLCSVVCLVHMTGWDANARC